MFATLGRRALAELGEATAFTFVMRGIARPPELPENVVWLQGRPPFPVEDEVAMLRRHEVRALFIQASGGELTYAKIAAARELELPVVMLTAYGSVPVAVEAMKRGACDFLQKPVDRDALLHVVQKALLSGADTVLFLAVAKRSGIAGLERSGFEGVQMCPLGPYIVHLSASMRGVRTRRTKRPGRNGVVRVPAPGFEGLTEQGTFGHTGPPRGRPRHSR